MVFVYLDLETDSTNIDQARIALCGILVGKDQHAGFFSTARELITSLQNMYERFDWMVVIGFNTTRFDYPLISRDTGELRTIYDNWFTVELQQIMLYLRRWRYKGNSLLGALEHFKLPVEKHGSGEDAQKWAHEWLDEKNVESYNQLKQHCEADLQNTRRIYEKLRNITEAPEFTGTS
jgi:uncharacterized protein YprB with RNaseH-like and TPR domain